MQDVNIVGILVNAFPKQLSDVHRQIELLHGKVYLQDTQGKLVVVLEAENDGIIADTMTKIEQIPGVINTVLVYHGIG